MNKNDQTFIVQKIRSQYIEKESSELDKLRELDRAVHRPVNIFAYVFGSISAIIMGAGMSLVMTDIGSMIGIVKPLIPGIIIGIVGMAMAAVNYPIYKRILSGRKNKFGAKILEISDNLVNN